LQRQLQPRIYLLLLPPSLLLEVLYLPLVLPLSLMGDRSRNFLVAELGDANRLFEPFSLGNLLGYHGQKY
jgi:hypothetical protein